MATGPDLTSSSAADAAAAAAAASSAAKKDRHIVSWSAEVRTGCVLFVSLAVAEFRVRLLVLYYWILGFLWLGFDLGLRFCSSCSPFWFGKKIRGDSGRVWGIIPLLSHFYC